MLRENRLHLCFQILTPKLLSLNSLAIAGFLAMAVANKPLSGGAPSASTGAPEEQTCAMSTCHDDKGLNTGTARFSLELPETVKAGERIPVKIKAEDGDKLRFGFQITSLDGNRKKAGTFVLRDSFRTQIIGAHSSLPGREYLTYTYAGTSVETAGSIEWDAYWDAPAQPGKVYFYGAGVSANNDGEDSGDEVFTFEQTVTVTASAFTRKVSETALQLQVINRTLNIENLQHNLLHNIQIQDMQGRVLYQKALNLTVTHYTEVLAPWLKGPVFITINGSKGSLTQKCYLHDQ